MVAAFRAYPQRDIGHKLETAVFLEFRRSRKALFYHANAHEIDLCDDEGNVFANACWNLDETDTIRRAIREPWLLAGSGGLTRAGICYTMSTPRQ